MSCLTYVKHGASLSGSYLQIQILFILLALSFLPILFAVSLTCCNFLEAVIWGHISDEVAQAAEEDLTAVKDELRSNQMRRWQTVGMLKHIYSFINLPWDLKKEAINLLLCITDGNLSQKCDDEHTDLSSFMPNLFASLQVVSDILSLYNISNLSSY